MAFYRVNSSGGTTGGIPSGKAIRINTTLASEIIDIPASFKPANNALIMNASDISTIQMVGTGAPSYSNWRCYFLDGSTMSGGAGNTDTTYNNVNSHDLVIVGSELNQSYTATIYITRT